MGFPIDIVGSKNSWIKISYAGVYDFNKFYRNIINWFKTNQYFFNEKNHIEAVRSSGKDWKIDFIASKEVDEYAKYTINIDIWALRTTKLSEGTYKGEIQIRIKGSMEVDYKNKFERYGKTGRVLRSFYNKYVIKKRLWTKYAANIYNDSNSLITSIKTDLGLVTR